MKPGSIALLCGSILLSGCQLLTSTQQGQVASERWQGTLHLSEDHWQFTRCAGGDSLQLQFDDTWLQATEGCEPGTQSCFADLEFQRDGANVARVSKVHRIQGEGRGCDDEDFDHLIFRAFGNEPFWNLRLNDQGLVLQQLGQPTVALPYIHEQLGSGQHYISSQADHQDLHLWISPEPCTDSMAGGWHAHSARLQWQGETLTGCAYQGKLTATSP